MTWHLVVRDMTIVYSIVIGPTVNKKLTYFACFHHLRCNTIFVTTAANRIPTNFIKNVLVRVK